MQHSLLRNSFLSLIGVLLGMGLLMVYSASITARPTEFEQVYLSRHLTFLSGGVCVGLTAAFLPSRFWRWAAPWLFGLTLILLAIVLVPGIGHRVNGAQRWLRFGSISMQPSEIAKVTLPLLVCWWLTPRRNAPDEIRSRFRSWLTRFAVIVPIGLTLGLIVVEPDLGTAAFLGGIAGIALFLSRWPIRNFVISTLAVAPLATTALVLRPYQWQRIQGFLTAWRDIDLAPYQVRQSLTTLGVGGIHGVGLGSGWQKLSFLPEANTDFVFAVLGEELGLIGTLGLIALWTALFLLGLRLLAVQPVRSFEFTAGATLLTQVVLQAALNVAVVTAMVPPKGIAHPLISYGGSSLVVTLAALGIVVSMSRRDTAALTEIGPPAGD
ncbi:MAG: cell division protein FtsW [Planctomycetota bacterium]|nr:MAG: cell division protein FtsW [Planctomycetota bacterium]REJ85665.1 MAG: cell division protein FtsW [Planctomycetota bacterium]REK21443.1 MAG: cell division protein FtsW [Planctomycetota bacterium]REK40045.1 MAG: cell division protein FtsW [Planctomycetota bacterium]